jgi:FO synthase
MSISTLMRNFPHSRRLTRDEATDLVSIEDIGPLLDAAASRRDAAHGRLVSYSRKVFIPLTQLCRDVCHYCTFVHAPREGKRPYLSIDQMVAIAQAGKKAECKEALFTLGDKPELRYRSAREELGRLGHPTTLSYILSSGSGERGAPRNRLAASPQSRPDDGCRHRHPAQGFGLAGHHAGESVGAPY